MLITGDPCDPIFQVRMVIGDTEEELVADEVISFALSENTNNVRAASIQVLKYIVAYVANQMSHSVGEVWIDNKKLYEQMKDLLKEVTSDPSYITATLGILIGGTSKTEIARVVDDTDVQSAPIKVGFYEE